MPEDTFSDTRQIAVATARIVTAVHACVPGRIRWRVPGLRQNLALKQALEAGLRELPGIHSASASAATGNLLTLFDPDLSADRISGAIAALVRGYVGSVRQHPAGPEWHAQEAGIAVEALQTSARLGLTTDAARERLAEHGANALPPPPVRSTLAIFLDQFQNL
ncbi:MAG TPA: cation-transporting P-type ATPase, partial [Rhodopila sp.]|nr:cation-transporting P-type ATPase [Rhodopila sp.]